MIFPPSYPGSLPALPAGLRRPPQPTFPALFTPGYSHFSSTTLIPPRHRYASTVPVLSVYSTDSPTSSHISQIRYSCHIANQGSRTPVLLPVNPSPAMSFAFLPGLPQFRGFPPPLAHFQPLLLLRPGGLQLVQQQPPSTTNSTSPRHHNNAASPSASSDQVAAFVSGRVELRR